LDIEYICNIAILYGTNTECPENMLKYPNEEINQIPRLGIFDGGLKVVYFSLKQVKVWNILIIAFENIPVIE